MKKRNNLQSLVMTFSLLFLAQSSLVSADDLNCMTSAKNASYSGPYKGIENNLTTADFLLDLKCSDDFIKNKYPNKFVTLFGSSRIHEKNTQGSTIVNEANDKLYQQIYNLSFKWTKNHSKQYPILTGAGPGIMEAGSRGAFEAGGPSIGYTTYYGPSRKNGGDATKAFWKYRPSSKNGSNKKSKTIVTDGLIFTSVAIRESVMILHSAAMVFAPGGTGTEWEIFQSIEQIKSGQFTKIPFYIVGDKKIHWQAFYDRLEDMIKRGTISRHEVDAIIVHVDNPEDVFKLLEKDLAL